MKILIAEDDAVAMRVLQLTLEKLGHEVVLARSGMEAWVAFDREPVRVIVSDWMMPDLDGLEFCARVRGRTKTPYTYFILLTAVDAGADNYSAAITAGIDDFLNKPLDREMIRMRLRVAERILNFTTEVRQLRELIPICSYCHNVRNDSDYWERVDTYINAATGSRFSHCICPDCFAKQMSDLGKDASL